MTIRATLLCAVLAIPLFGAAPAAPVPAQILAARKVFVGNAGTDQYRDWQLFGGGPARPYNDFYAAMKTWGRYELAAAPSDADLLMEIALTVSTGDQRDKMLEYDPRLSLVVRDPKTHAVLWAVTEHVQWAILQGNREKNLAHAMDRVMAELHRVVEPSPARP